MIHPNVLTVCPAEAVSLVARDQKYINIELKVESYIHVYYSLVKDHGFLETIQI